MNGGKIYTGYNLQSLVELVVDVLPNEKKYSFTREAKAENVSEEVRIKAELGIWDSIKETLGDAYDGIKDIVGDLLIATVPTILKDLFKKFKFW